MVEEGREMSEKGGLDMQAEAEELRKLRACEFTDDWSADEQRKRGKREMELALEAVNALREDGAVLVDVNLSFGRCIIRATYQRPRERLTVRDTAGLGVTAEEAEANAKAKLSEALTAADIRYWSSKVKPVERKKRE